MRWDVSEEEGTFIRSSLIPSFGTCSTFRASFSDHPPPPPPSYVTWLVSSFFFFPSLGSVSFLWRHIWWRWDLHFLPPSLFSSATLIGRQSSKSGGKRASYVTLSDPLGKQQWSALLYLFPPSGWKSSFRLRASGDSLLPSSLCLSLLRVPPWLYVAECVYVLLPLLQVCST